MSTQAQYASTPKISYGTVVTGDASRSAPTLANVGTAFTAGANGARLEKIQMQAIGSTTASMLRLFLVQGFPGATIASIVFSGTTATVTTSAAHGMTTGNLATVQGAAPREYNVTNAAVTVTGPSTYTYVMASAPTVNATALGYYSYTPAAPVYALWGEVPTGAINTVSSTNPALTLTLSAATNPSTLPLTLPPGWSLRATINDTQAGGGVNVFGIGGDL